MRGLAEYYYSPYFRTREHGISLAGVTLLGLLSTIHPGFAVIAVLVYLGLPVYFYATDPDLPNIDSPGLDPTRSTTEDTPLISVNLVPTVAGDNSPPDTHGMRNAEVRFSSDRATVHASVDINQSCERYCLRFEAPDPPIDTELRGAPLAEQTFEAPNRIRCDNVRTYGFDPVIDLYVDDPRDLRGGDYMMRVYDEYEDVLISQARLISS